LASDRVVIETVVAKYCDHVPLYRQEAMLEREAGVEISRATLDGWVMRVGELLQPVVEAMRADVLGASYLQADETIVPVQMHDNRGARIIRHICGSMERPAARRFLIFNWVAVAMVRRNSSKIGMEFCRPTVIRLMTRWAAAHLIHVGCWAHARRKFVDAVKVNPKDGAAIAMVTRMDALFLVDRHAREQELNVEERSDLRREHAHPWVDEIHSECGKLRGQLLPKSALGEAVNYTLNMWAKLKRCFDHAEVELSNNIAENSMRPVALGRKNWLHVGSAEVRLRRSRRFFRWWSLAAGWAYRSKTTCWPCCRASLRGKLSELAQLTPTNWKAARA
jgi:transposase